MKKNYQFENEAFELLMKLEEGSISNIEVVSWADEKLENNTYDDTLADISMWKESSPKNLYELLKDLIGNYRKTEIEYLRKEAIRTSKMIIAEEIHMILGCRKIDRILSEIGLDEIPDFRLFCGIDSEADGYPITDKERSLWNPASLMRKDKEYKVAVETYLPELKDCCRKLILEIEQGTGVELRDAPHSQSHS